MLWHRYTRYSNLLFVANEGVNTLSLCIMYLSTLLYSLSLPFSYSLSFYLFIISTYWISLEGHKCLYIPQGKEL